MIKELAETLGNPYLQLLFWTACILFSIYFAYQVKKMSFGEDTGTKAWFTIMTGLTFMGLRVLYKILFPNYSSSYNMQLTRFSLGIIGIITLLLGFNMFRRSLQKIYGEEN